MLNVDFFSYLSGEFQVLRGVGARFNDSNLVQRAIDVYPSSETWKISNQQG